MNEQINNPTMKIRYNISSQDELKLVEEGMNLLFSSYDLRANGNISVSRFNGLGAKPGLENKLIIVEPGDKNSHIEGLFESKNNTNSEGTASTKFLAGAFPGRLLLEINEYSYTIFYNRLNLAR